MISRRLSAGATRALTVLVALAALVPLSIASCGGDECFRYSDCDNGLTCAAGKCVVPASNSDGGDLGEGGDAEASTPDAAKPDTSLEKDAAPTDSANDGGDDGGDSGDDSASDGGNDSGTDSGPVDGSTD